MRELLRGAARSFPQGVAINSCVTIFRTAVNLQSDGVTEYHSLHETYVILLLCTADKDKATLSTLGQQQLLAS